MAKKTIRDVVVSGKKVLVRCDFNVPLDETGHVTDETRLVGALPTIQELLAAGAAVILCSHLGRPKGQVNEKYSLKPVAKRLSELLGKPVIMAADVIGPDAKAKAAALKPGEVMLLENVRFHAEEEKNDPAFAKELASMADLFVNDAFGTAHRAHASTEGVAHFLPAVSGLLVEKEVRIMGDALEHPAHPMTVVFGGAKVADKLLIIRHVLGLCDNVLIGGGMAYTFLKAEGFEVGTSLCETEMLGEAKELMELAKQQGVQLLLPVDVLCASELSANAVPAVYGTDHIPANLMGLDIGPKTRERYTQVLSASKTVIWNGPMGVFELPAFAEGTKAVAKAIAETDCVSIIGGGDSAAAVEQLGYADRMTHISTGGGASLEFLGGITLPGIACLQDQ